MKKGVLTFLLWALVVPVVVAFGGRRGWDVTLALVSAVAAFLLWAAVTVPWPDVCRDKPLLVRLVFYGMLYLTVFGVGLARHNLSWCPAVMMAILLPDLFATLLWVRYRERRENP